MLHLEWWNFLVIDTVFWLFAASVFKACYNSFCWSFIYLEFRAIYTVEDIWSDLGVAVVFAQQADQQFVVSGRYEKLFKTFVRLTYFKFQDIADSAYKFRKGRPTLIPSISKLIADILFSLLVQALFLFQVRMSVYLKFRIVIKT